jgi:hypothetical protein
MHNRQDGWFIDCSASNTNRLAVRDNYPHFGGCGINENGHFSLQLMALLFLLLIRI